MRKTAVLLLLTGVFLLAAGSLPDTSAETLCRGFLEDRGWQVGALLSEEMLWLPEGEDPTWTSYYALQRENGFLMEKYAGKEVQKFSFRIDNHPDGENAYANLYWYDGAIIGGDVLSPALNGFMHGLKPSNF